MSESQYRWLTPESQQFMERGYLMPNQTVDERVNIICDRAEELLKKPGYAKKLKRNIQNGWNSLSTPIWANFGTQRGLPISCFGTNVSDSMSSIASAVAEVIVQTKNGGGTSAILKLRPRGSVIKDNGHSGGAAHFSRMFDGIDFPKGDPLSSIKNLDTLLDVQRGDVAAAVKKLDDTMCIISQGKTRRGNCAVWLEAGHPDIMEFLTIKQENSSIQELFFGVVITDEWMHQMLAGDTGKRMVWAKILERRKERGLPYLMFKDAANRGTVDCYKDKGMTISHSNLCVTGDQLVVTSNGMKTVRELYESQESLTLFDGKKAVKASPMRLVEKNVPIYLVETVSGRTHKVTGYHKIKTCRGMVQAKDLLVGDKVCVQKEKGLFGKLDDPKKAFLLGLYQGDGTQTDQLIAIDVWEDDFDLKTEIEDCISSIYNQHQWTSYKVAVPGRGTYSRKALIPKFFKQQPTSGGVAKSRLQSAKLKQFGFAKGSIPSWIWQANEKTQWQYIRGLLYTDGSVNVGSSKGNPVQISFSSTNVGWLREIQILMSNLGLKPSIHPLSDGGMKPLPDGKGGSKEYLCNPCWRLIVSNKSDALVVEKETGFLTRRGVRLENRKYRDNTKKFDAVKSVTVVENEDVYCTTVSSDEHVWTCNSFITSNCTEIFLPDDDLESFICCISSMNLLYYDEWKNTDAVETIVYLLEAALTEFINRAKDIPHMERTVRFAERHRALGVGRFNWHGLLQSKMVPFESMEAKRLNVEIAKTIKEQCYAASAKMAHEYGEPDVLKGYGRRHTTLNADAPTKSSAFIIGQGSENSEAFTSNISVSDLQKGKFVFRNPHLVRLVKEKGWDEQEIFDLAIKRGGSVQHIDKLSQHEKSVFKTADEISQMEVLIQASQRQKYIDQGQSVNIRINPFVISNKSISDFYIRAWELGLKSIYYQYGVNAASDFSRDIMHCTACE